MRASNARHRCMTAAPNTELKGPAYSARRSCSSFSMLARTRILSAAVFSTACGESPVRQLRSAANVAARERASSISRSNKSSRRRRASCCMELFQSAFKLQELVGNASGVDVIAARSNGLLHRGYLLRVDNRRLGHSLFDLLQSARG